ncbi:hypothetical protein A6X21_08050 [Planctopirus hydrillae]|uniref:Uncharacterized protein n=1 Tax=Planctopirus hydrillae TaxID=1841610 RepID=A0A1C3E8N6_9PLAN|nr:hypothetical protein A6X21_08050 [Planctopirus hydrillae]
MRRIDLPDSPSSPDDRHACCVSLSCRPVGLGWVFTWICCFTLVMPAPLFAEQKAASPSSAVSGAEADNKPVPPFDPVEESFLVPPQPVGATPGELPPAFDRDDAFEEWASEVLPVSNQSSPQSPLPLPPSAQVNTPAAQQIQPPLPPAPEAGKTTGTTATEDPNSPVPWAGNDRPVVSLKASIALPAGEIPRNRAREMASTLPTQVMVTGISRPWLWQEVEWEAAATRHLPLYFEEPMLERLGYTHGWGRETCDYCATDCDRMKAEAFQPFVSAAAFFGRVPILPYQMGVDLPWEPIYTLGEPLPGSPAPYEKRMIPWSLRGALFQAGATTGAVFIVP